MIGKTLKMPVDPATSQQEILKLVSDMMEQAHVGKTANILYGKDMVMICAMPICPFCDMDFGNDHYLWQHLQQRTCMVS